MKTQRPSKLPFRQKIDLLCAGARYLPHSDRKTLSRSLSRFCIIANPFVDVAVLGARSISPRWLTGVRSKKASANIDASSHGLFDAALLAPDRAFRDADKLEVELARAIEAYNADPASSRKIGFRGMTFVLSCQNGNDITLRPYLPMPLLSQELPASALNRDRALSDLSRYIDDNPSDLHAQFCRAMILLRKGSYEIAANSFKRLIDDGIRDQRVTSGLSDALYCHGNMLFSRGHIIAAHEKYVEAFLAYPKSPRAKDAMISSAITLWDADLIFSSYDRIAERGFSGEAIEGFREMISLDKRLATRAKNHLFNLYVNLAEDARASNDLGSALELYSEAYRLQQDPQILVGNAVLLYELGRYGESYALFSQLMEKTFIPPSALSVFGMVCLKIGQHPRDALRVFERAFRGLPGNAQALLGKGMALLRIGELNEAIETLTPIAEKNPEASGLLSAARRVKEVADSSLKASDIDLEALSSIEIHALEAHISTRREAFGLYGDPFYVFREKCFRTILRKDPSDTLAMQRLAFLLYKQGKLEEAESLSRKAFSLDPGNPGAFEDFVRLLQKRGKIEEARGLIDAEMLLRPTADTYRISALHERDFGDADIAISHFSKAVDLDPHNHLARVKWIRLLIDKKTDEDFDRAMRLCLEGKKLAPDLFQYDRAMASIHMRRKEYPQALQVQLDQHARMSAVKGKGPETRSQMQWLELRIADVYRDLREPELCRSWFEMAMYPPLKDPQFLQTADNIIEWLKDIEYHLARSRSRKERS